MTERPVGPPSTSEALAVIERERTTTASRLTPNPTLLYGVWGFTYLAVGVLWYLQRIGMLGGIAAAVTGVLIGAAAVAISITMSVRATRGVRSANAPAAIRLGFAWSITLALTAVLAAGVAVTQPAATRDLLIPTFVVFVVGALCCSFAVAWRSTPLLGTGLWISTVAAAAVFVPAPAHLLVLAVGAGGAFVALAVWLRVR